MKHSLFASMRRVNRMLRPAKMSKASQSMQRAVTGMMIDTAMAPLTAMTPPKPARRKAGARKAAVSTTAKKPSGKGKQLKTKRSLLPRAKSSRPSLVPRIPTGAQFITRKHRSATGSRSYRLYLPASAPQAPNGLILMLHGCNQTADDFAVGTHMNAVAEKHGLAVAYPEQTRRSNGASCWNWFRPRDQFRGAGEPAMLAALARKLTREFGLDRSGVFVAGLSAGGAMAAILVDVYPDVFSAAGIHSGLPRGAAHNTLSAMSAMRSGGNSEGAVPATLSASPVRRIVFQGDSDKTIHPSNAPGLVTAALGLDAVPARTSNRSVRGRAYARSNFAGEDGKILLELWVLEGGGHTWSGGRAAGSYTDTKGPDASVQMVRFFLA
ncbi:MAG: PHB depolymerase family esterase [Roseovarius sp.]